MPTTIANEKRRVFLVDDHPLVREWLTCLINQQPDLVVCGEASEARAAVPAIQASQAEVALIDISLHDTSGIDLIADLRRLCPTLAILVFSMHDESLYAERTLRAGAKGYIMKREATHRVIEAIRCVLQGKFFLSETIAQSITRQFVEGKPVANRSPLELLSDRELMVFGLLGEGLGTRQMAERLRVSIKTVQAHCARIKEKLNLVSATELLREAVRNREERKPEVPRDTSPA